MLLVGSKHKFKSLCLRRLSSEKRKYNRRLGKVM